MTVEDVLIHKLKQGNFRFLDLTSFFNAVPALIDAGIIKIVNVIDDMEIVLYVDYAVDLGHYGEIGSSVTYSERFVLLLGSDEVSEAVAKRAEQFTNETR